MNMISASAAASATAPLPFDHDAETAACVFTAAGLLLPHLERGQRVDAATLRGMREAVGRTITVMPDRFENPLYESCNGRPNYDQVARRPRAEAEQAFQRYWSAPRLQSPMPVAGMVRCHLPEVRVSSLGSFVFEYAQRGSYRWEGGAVAVLR